MKTLAPALTLAASLLLAACGGKADKAADDTTPEATAEAADTTPAPADDGADESPAETTGEQTFAEAMTFFCEAPSKSGAADTTADQKATVLAKYIQDNASNKEFLDMMAGMSSMAPDERKPRVEEAVAKAGLTECEMLNQL